MGGKGGSKEIQRVRGFETSPEDYAQRSSEDLRGS